MKMTTKVSPNLSSRRDWELMKIGAALGVIFMSVCALDEEHNRAARADLANCNARMAARLEVVKHLRNQLRLARREVHTIRLVESTPANEESQHDAEH